MATTIRFAECTASALYVSLELGSTKWVVLSTTSVAQRPRRAMVRAGDRAALLAELQRARGRFHLPITTVIYSCFEAGRDGFWLHRWLVQHDVQNIVVDSSSIRISRRHRAAKTDRLDAEQLVQMLIRHVAGEPKVWSTVHVPTVEAEDRRQLNREIESVKQDRNRVWSRMTSLLATQGIIAPRAGDLMAALPTLRTGDGRALGPLFQARLTRECQQLASLDDRFAVLHEIRREQIRAGQEAVSRCARRLLEMRGIGQAGAEMLSAELFGTRTFHNGRQLGALLGLAPMPYRSDQVVYEQGHSHAGRGALRGLMTQLAWGWLRWQPQSALTRWFHTRFATGSRQRRIGIVAVARKLVIALWHYVEHGVVPDGAALKA